MYTSIVDIHSHNQQNGVPTLTSHGVHPWHADSSLLPLSSAPFECVDAVGEVGLDYACGVSKGEQQRLFEAQLEIAQRLGKIVVIHSVRAYEDILSTLKGYELGVVIFHGFIGSVQLMRRIINQGYYLSYGSPSFRSPKTLAALCDTPLDRLFFESDDSGVDVAYVYAQAASYLSISESDLEVAIYENYKKILNKIH